MLTFSFTLSPTAAVYLQQLEFPDSACLCFYLALYIPVSLSGGRAYWFEIFIILNNYKFLMTFFVVCIKF